MRITEYIEHLNRVLLEHGDIEVAHVAEDLTGNVYALVFKAPKPFLVNDVPQNDQFTFGDYIKSKDVVVVGVSR